jgi:cellulose synthase/poly-beta-1,6-N-acetylglucosamine synthase-like glycosyltransferase
MISAIIPTYNRAELLQASLDSLAAQSLPQADYEVVVIDDGSTDWTCEVCESFGSRMNIRYFRIENSGIAAAKNLGVFAAIHPILLFFDDDDIADRNLLAEHVRMHRRYPLENIAVLGYTAWAPTLPLTTLMHYVTEVGCFLFSYPHMVNGQILDFTAFWGGRSSCKRSLLVKRGVFNQRFRFGSEDIELGYRLSQFGLKVIFNRNAVQYMNRPISFAEFCRRCEKQGRSQVGFARLHPDSAVIQKYCGVLGAQERWTAAETELESSIERVREIEEFLQHQWHSADANTSNCHPQIKELWRLYGWTFNAFKVKGVVEALAENANTSTKPNERRILIYS